MQNEPKETKGPAKAPQPPESNPDEPVSDTVTARVQKVADGMAKTFRENPDLEVPY